MGKWEQTETESEMELASRDGHAKDVAKDDDGRPRRTGNVLTASAHVITAVIGSGVLSLAWSIAQLGWIAGPVVLLAFAFVTYFTSNLLANCYRSPDPVNGKRNYTYMQAVEANLGGYKIFFCGLVQNCNLVGTAIGYTITASISAVAISRSNCFHNQGKHSPCHVSNNTYMVVFGLCQVILSQISNFGKIWWLSIFAALMSFAYSFIGLGLEVAKVAKARHIYGTKGGVPVGQGLSHSMKTWRVFQALGNIAFAYSFSLVLIEIQDTLRSPPAENKTMKKATLVGVCITSLFYISLGCLGYAAFGNDAPGNLLTGFGFYDPYWLVDIGNACIVAHLVGAYQVYCQPVFALVENWVLGQWPKSKFLHNHYSMKMPLAGFLHFNLFIILWRTCFVIFTTLVAMLLPFFNDIMGLIGAITFWPLTVFFPIEMYIKEAKITSWSSEWLGLQTLSIVCLIISIAAFMGSLAGTIEDLKHSYIPFKTRY